MPRHGQSHPSRYSSNRQQPARTPPDTTRFSSRQMEETGFSIMPILNPDKAVAGIEHPGRNLSPGTQTVPPISGNRSQSMYRLPGQKSNEMHSGVHQLVLLGKEVHCFKPATR